MITFTNLGLYGRLGNALFQYALVRSVSLKTNKPLCLPNLSAHIEPVGGQSCKLNNFNIKYETLIEKPRYLFKEKKYGSYDSEVFNVPDGTDFFGFFQNKKYFEDIKHILKIDLQLNEQIQKQALDILSQFTRPTSIHVRLGDYLDLNQGVYDWQSKLQSYINKARSVIGTDGDILVFTGGKRFSNESSSYFDWCREHIKGNNVYYMEGNSEILDFELIRRCHNNITGWDSTYSWWASYLNDTKGKIICTKDNQIFPWIYYDMKEWITI